MEGVEILSTEQVVTKYSLDFTECLIVAVMIMVISLIIGFLVILRTGDRAYMEICILFGSIASVIGYLITIPFVLQPIEYETQYKVIISDDISMIEFNERYEIIAQKNYDTFIVRERE